MAAAGLLKVNLTREKCGFVARCPRAFRKADIRPTTYGLLSLVWGFGERKDKETGEQLPFEAYKTTYDQLQEELGACRASVSNAIKEAEELGFIERLRNEDGTTSYKFVGEIDLKLGYDKIPLYLNSVEVKYKGKWRKIPPKYRRVLAEMMAKGEVLNERRCQASISALARRLSMPRSTVFAAIAFLLETGVITRKESDKGDCRSHKQSVYYIEENLYKYKLEGKLARMSPERQQKELKKVCEKYYVDKQKENEKFANDYASWRKNSKLFRELDRAIGNLELAKAKAELGWIERTLEDVEEEQKRLQEALQEALNKAGYDPARTKIEYYITCRCCQDTGTKANGTPCDCWKRGVLW